MRKVKWMALLLASGAIAPAFGLPIVEIQFATDGVTLSDTVIADVMVSGLDNEWVGSYDLTLGWDPGLLSFGSLQFGTALDGPFDSLQDFTATNGLLNVWEVSLSMLSQQDGFAPINLFSIMFSTTGIGAAALGFNPMSPQIIGDAFGIGYDASYVGSTVTVSAPVSVPEPSTLALLGCGLLAFVATRTRCKSKAVVTT